jgi:DNA-nicking Smr family endonuclease
MIISKSDNTLTADIHGMQVANAKTALERLISSADKNITEIMVIHGYSGGQVLMNMVRKKLSHPRIARKILSMNQGETLLMIKE